MKSLFFSLIACSAAFVMAAETALIPAQTADWQKINGRGALSVEKINGEEVFAVKGQANYRSEKMLKIAPEKIYKLTGEFMAKPGTVPAKLYFGFMPFDEKQKPIFSERIFPVSGTETEIAEAVNAGDKVIKLKDCSKWKANGGFLAMNVKPDCSDLPNMEISPEISSRQKEGEIYTVTLKKPMVRAYAKGTKVRQHRSAGTYQYSGAGNARLNNQEWQKFSAVINGEAKKNIGIQGGKWWFGTRYVKIMFLGNYAGNADSVMYFRNVKLEELTR